MQFVPIPGTNILMSIWETRVQDYAAFAAANPGVNDEWRITGGASRDPVANVSWDDAQAFCQWLSKKESKTYRLPTDHEWSVAVGIGDREDSKARPSDKDMKIKDVYSWGTQWPPPKGAGNYGSIDGYSDVHSIFAPVGSYYANELGIYDLGGNVYEWCADICDVLSASRVLRGASWDYNAPNDLLASNRLILDQTSRYLDYGFRVVVGVGERKSP
jgi:formylglycine-generating enzyme required for sulfatase activity